MEVRHVNLKKVLFCKSGLSWMYMAVAAATLLIILG